MHGLALAVAVVAQAAACSPAGDEPGAGSGLDLPAPDPGEGYQIATSATAPPGEEIWACEVQRLPNSQWEMIGEVESLQTDNMHHMDVMALAYADVDLAPGVYDCGQVYADHPELMDDGLVLYGAQEASQVVELPDGVAANLPPDLLVMHELHYVNTTDQPVEVFSAINMYAMDPREVEDTIWGGVVRDLQINIPPRSEKVEWSRCVMNEDVEVLFLASHTHQHGREVSVRRFDGDQVEEEPIYVNTDWQSPELQSFTDDPIDVSAGQGFEFRCDFVNSSDEPVTWGFTARDEMCQIAFVYTPGDANAACEIVESSDGLHDDD